MYIGGIDLGGTKTMVGITDEHGNILSSCTIDTNIADHRAHLTNCCQCLLQCAQKLGIHIRQLTGLGVTVPGLADPRQGILIKAVFAGWNQIRIADFFKQLLEVDVFVENDVNACAIAELQFGYKSRYQNFLWMTISTGVGGAVVCNGRLIRGVDGYAGEIGHVKVEFEHPYPCPCSELGCLEAHGSGTAINRYVRELCLTDPDFLAELQTNGYSSDAVGCAALALQGNSAAQSVFNKAGTYLGKGISHYVNILNPEAIILGGGVARSFSLLEKPIRDTMKQTVFRPLKHVDVVTTKLGYEAAFLGAAALVLS